MSVYDKRPAWLGAQSAMEYLMTYGWAILIIAVVLAVLYQLGVFSGASFSSTGCLASVGYLCSSPILNSSGFLSVTLGQSGQQNFDIVGVACTNSSVAPTSFNAISVELASGAQVQQAFYCKGIGDTLGYPFKGYLWLQYNTQTESGLVTQLATVTASVSTSQPVPGTSQILSPPISYSWQQNDCTSAASCTATITSGYPLYLCMGGDGDSANSDASWTEDAQYLFYATGALGTSIGHQSSDACTLTQPASGDESVAGIGVSTSSYSIITTGGISSSPYTIAWSPGSSSKTDFLFVATPYSITFTLPPGCTEPYSDGSPTSNYGEYLIVCTGKASYSVTGTVSSPNSGGQNWNQYVVYEFA